MKGIWQMTKRHEHEQELPDVDFSDLIMGFSSSALAYLGYDIDAPMGEHSAQNLALAKQNLDIVTMLQEKTKGNLSPAEQKLLDQVLGDLRLKFVEASKKQK